MDSPFDSSEDEEFSDTKTNGSANSNGGKSEIKLIELELKILTRRRDSLNSQINKLKERHKILSESYNLKQGLSVDDSYSKTDFPWSKKVEEILKEPFNLVSFRSKQLPAINLTLSKQDVILLMPTGGGKTLCYQLPAMVETGMTLVVSPLLALIEDQLIKLRELDINAMAMSSGTTKELKNKGFQYMSKGEGKPIKIMYVTPEWLAKSKKFMSSLQKLHEAQKLNRIAIDEVHCCSQWGHDFRPDYKFLGLLKGMFSDVPILGVTATATTAVLLDIQEMLDIQGCKIVRDRFDRPNLHYKVVPKEDKMEDNVKYLVKLLNTTFENKVGIIYTTTIKDCETLTKLLREKGLRVQPYHADLPDDLKTKIHRKWIDDKIQAVIATVAFGMGIDKLNVSFVIHYAVPKSMETLYQEGGRAGRNGKYAECIVMYKLGDYLKNSGYARSKTEVKNTLSVLTYCLNLETCRHQLIGVHFEDTEIPPCKEMCDNCLKRKKLKKYEGRSACVDVHKVIDYGLASEINLTLSKLVDLWLNPKIKITKPIISRRQAENIIGNLLLKHCIKEEKNYTPYSVNCYIRKNFLSEKVIITLQEESGLNNYLESYNNKRKAGDGDDESGSNKKSADNTIVID